MALRSNRGNQNQIKKTTHLIAQDTVNFAYKSSQSIGNWLAKDQQSTSKRMDFLTSLTVFKIQYNHLIAELGFQNRQLQRQIMRIDRFSQTGQETSRLEIIKDWIQDFIHYLWDVCWGVIKPILTHILWLIYLMLLMLLVWGIYIGGIYYMLKS